MASSDLIDFYEPEGALLWFHLVDDGSDLSFESCSDTFIGDPTWLEDYEPSWEQELGIPWRREPGDCGWEFTSSVYIWAMQEGIAPEQPFQVYISKPRWYRCSWEYEEYDAEVDCWVEKIKRIPIEEHLRRWEEFLEARRKYKIEMNEYRRKLKHLRETDVGAMFLQTDVYWHRSPVDYLPDGLIIRLCSKHSRLEDPGRFGIVFLLEGRDNDGRRDVAFDNLVTKALERFPHLTEDQIKNLPWRR